MLYRTATNDNELGILTSVNIKLVYVVSNWKNQLDTRYQAGLQSI